MGVIVAAILASQGPIRELVNQPHNTKSKHIGSEPNSDHNKTISLWRSIISPADPLVTLTFLLVISNVAMAGATLYLALFTRKSVKIAERALTELERPYIFIWGIRGTVPIMTQYSSGQEPVTSVYPHVRFNYSVSNNGRLAAVVDEISIGCGYIKGSIYLPLVIIGDHSLINMPIISPGREIKDLGHEEPSTQFNLIVSPGAFRFNDGVVFRICIKYHGPLTRGHETAIGVIYRQPFGFVEINDSAYTYTK
jgi:hypothetical protein